MYFPDQYNCKTCKWCGTITRKKCDPTGLPDLTVYTCKRKGTESLTFMNAGECVCNKYQKMLDPVDEWNKAIEGKPIGEWPPMPKELELIKYENGIVLTTQAKIEKWLKGVDNA